MVYPCKQNIKSCNAKHRRQRKRVLVTSPPKINRSNNCNIARAAHLLVKFIAVVLHDYNVALPSYTFYGGSVVSVPVRFSFLLPLIFTLLVASISHFLTAAKNFSCFSRSNEIGFFSFAVIDVNVDIKINFSGKN